jgi:hypothetical protein
MGTKKVPFGLYVMLISLLAGFFSWNLFSAGSAIRLADINILEFQFSATQGCTGINLAKLSERVGMPEDPLEIVLFYNGQKVAVLGKSRNDSQLPATVEIKMPIDPLDAIRRGRGHVAGFQIRLVNSAGKVVAKQNVALKRRLN